MTEQLTQLPRKAGALLPVLALPLMAGVEAIGQEMLEGLGPDDVEEGTTGTSHFSEWFMEDMSIATYSEARPIGRRSTRALANIVRIDRADQAKVRNIIGYRDDDFNNYAMADIVLSTLRHNAEVQPALHLLAPKDLAVKGPFYPTVRSFKVTEGLVEMALQSQKYRGEDVHKILNGFFRALIKNYYQASFAPSTEDVAALKLAGLLRLDEQDLAEVARKLITLDALQPDSRQIVLARVVLAAVRSSARFAVGLNALQPKQTAAT